MCLNNASEAWPGCYCKECIAARTKPITKPAKCHRGCDYGTCRNYTTCEHWKPKTIDWSKPVQTSGGRRLRVLSTDGPEPYPVVVEFDDRPSGLRVALYKRDGTAADNGAYKDAVQAPVEHHLWVNLWADRKNRPVPGIWHTSVENAKPGIGNDTNYLHTIVFTFDDKGNYLRSEKINLRNK